MSGIDAGNLFARLTPPTPDERFETLLDRDGVTLERIVSHGQATPDGEWLSQLRAEWVVLLKGAAGLRFEEEVETRQLRPGDYLYIPADTRHRVEWTSETEPTVWLALHVPGNES